MDPPGELSLLSSLVFTWHVVSTSSPAPSLLPSDSLTLLRSLGLRFSSTADGAAAAPVYPLFRQFSRDQIRRKGTAEAATGFAKDHTTRETVVLFLSLSRLFSQPSQERFVSIMPSARASTRRGCEIKSALSLRSPFFPDSLALFGGPFSNGASTLELIGGTLDGRGDLDLIRQIETRGDD